MNVFIMRYSIFINFLTGMALLGDGVNGVIQETQMYGVFGRAYIM